MGRFSSSPDEPGIHVLPTNHRRTCPILDSICSTEALATYGSAAFTVSEVALVESHLGERRHEVLYCASLSGV